MVAGNNLRSSTYNLHPPEADLPFLRRKNQSGNEPPHERETARATRHLGAAGRQGLCSELPQTFVYLRAKHVW